MTWLVGLGPSEQFKSFACAAEGSNLQPAHTMHVSQWNLDFGIADTLAAHRSARHKQLRFCVTRLSGMDRVSFFITGWLAS